VAGCWGSENKRADKAEAETEGLQVGLDAGDVHMRVAQMGRAKASSE